MSNERCPKKWTYEEYRSLSGGASWGGDWNVYKDDIFTCDNPMIGPSTALSREDNITYVCPNCGLLEGLQALRQSLDDRQEEREDREGYLLSQREKEQEEMEDNV